MRKNINAYYISQKPSCLKHTQIQACRTELDFRRKPDQNHNATNLQRRHVWIKWVITRGSIDNKVEGLRQGLLRIIWDSIGTKLADKKTSLIHEIKWNAREKTYSIYLHLLFVGWDNEFVCFKKTQGMFFLGYASAKNRHIQSKSLPKLHCHVAETAKSNHTKRFTRLIHLMPNHRSINSNSSTKQRSSWS